MQYVPFSRKGFLLYGLYPLHFGDASISVTLGKQALILSYRILKLLDSPANLANLIHVPLLLCLTPCGRFETCFELP